MSILHDDAQRAYNDAKDAAEQRYRDALDRAWRMPSAQQCHDAERAAVEQLVADYAAAQELYREFRRSTSELPAGVPLPGPWPGLSGPGSAS